MAKFCIKCGAPLSTGPFCVKCGADMRNLAESAQPQSPPPAAQTTTQSAPLPGTPIRKRGMSTLAKLGIAAVSIIFVGGAAGTVGVYYVVHRVSQKIHQAADGILGSGSDSSTSSHGEGSGLGESESGRSAESGTIGDMCRLLSKDEVSKAIGVEIVRTNSQDNGCNYFAKGTQADMTAKHTAAIMASRGADQKTQQVVQNIAGGMFQAFAQQKPSSEQDHSGEVLVFNFSVDQHAAGEQMQLNAKGLSILGDTQSLPGIGDQAFASADGMIIVRKGRSLIRIMFLTCPCGVEAVKPLAKEIADAL